MSPPVATLICFIVILYLFWTDRKNKIDGVSKAIWVPFFWMFISGSRFVSQWINPNAALMSAEAYLEGSPLDRAVFLILIILGLVILIRRNLNWKLAVKKNTWIWLFLMFGLISVLWSDYPFVSFKRWIKALGTPIMALVIMTEERPLEAIGVLARRLAYVLLPLSVLFIKYYPNLGRAYHMGQPMFTGVALQKNGLGQICLVVGIYYCWDLLFNRQNRKDLRRLHGFLPYLLILPMLGWLIHMAGSSTSLMCLIIAMSILIVSRVPSVSKAPGRLMRLGLTAVLVLIALEVTLGVSAKVISALGRDPTLTNRVSIWQSLLAMAGNPLIGVGYESFWLGKRLAVLMDTVGVRQAHNGYLETYLNIGLVGLVLVVALMISGLVKARKEMTIDYRFAVLRLTFIVVVAIYNWTEATLYGVNNMWLLLFLGSIDVFPQRDHVIAVKDDAAKNSRNVEPRLIDHASSRKS
jgi:exopolysaccharide production protein ExoQ